MVGLMEDGYSLPRIRKRVSTAPKAAPVQPIEEAPLTLADVPPGTVTGQCEATFAIPPAGCHWPIGDPLDPLFHYCGATALKSFGYCAEHDKRAHKARPVST